MLYVIETISKTPRYFIYDDTQHIGGRYYTDNPNLAVRSFYDGHLSKTSQFLDWPTLRRGERVYATSDSHPELFI